MKRVNKRLFLLCAVGVIILILNLWFSLQNTLVIHSNGGLFVFSGFSFFSSVSININMEISNSAVVTVSSPSETLALVHTEMDSQFSSLIYDVSHKVQEEMENILKMTNEVDQSSAGIMEVIENSREFATERRRMLEEEKERCQKAAFSVINMLNN